MLFPVEALHFSIYFLLVSVSIFRHLIHQHCPKAALLVMAVITYTVLFGSPWLIALAVPGFSRTAMQLGMIWTSYDSVFMLGNVLIFCLACSLFISETRRKGMVSILVDYVLRLRRENVWRSKQLLQRDINYIELVKHLFAEE